MITYTNQSSSSYLTRNPAGFWLRWILVSAMGGAMIGTMFQPGDFLVHLILRGFIVGAMQWLVLRHVLPGAWWWIAATGLSLIAASFLSNLPGLPVNLSGLYSALYQQFGLWEVFWVNLVREAVVWGMVGVAQWLVLRRLPHAGWWIPLSVAGGAVLGMASATTCYLACDALAQSVGTPAPTIVTDGIAWALYGAATGWLLARMVRDADGIPTENRPA